MKAPDRFAPRRAGARAIVACVLVAAPLAASAELRLLEHDLQAPFAPEAAPATGGWARPVQPVLRLEAEPPASSSLDFDLLGPPRAPQAGSDRAPQRARRLMLGLHQATGLGLLGLQLATTVVGQLNYDDRFGGPDTARYQAGHKILAYSTLGAFAVTGLVALLVPAPPLKKAHGFDRVTLHRLAMATATAGMLAQGVLGVATRNREGYLDQERLARTHLVVGYLTLSAVLVGVGAFVL